MLLGVNLNHWRKEVERLWALSPSARSAEMERSLGDGGNTASNGTVVRSLTDLNHAPLMHKKHLRRKLKQSPAEGAFHRHTAGTTGEPTHIVLDRDELGRMLGVRDYCYRRCGICVGDREGRLWAREGSGMTDRIKNVLLNRKVFHPTGANKRAVVGALVRWQPSYLYGYSSLLLECARLLEEFGWSLQSLTCVICTAENILPSQKEYLERVFQCPVFEEYGSTEFDIIAFDCPRKERHIVNPWLELGTTDEGTLYVTDSSRTSQSLIKYLLGDSITLDESHCNLLGSDTVIQKILGRTQNRLAFVDPDSSFHAVEFAHAIDAYQREMGVAFTFTVVQERYGEFILDVGSSDEADPNALTHFIEQYIKDVTGYRVTIKLSQEGSSGDDRSKRSYFIQRIKDSNV